jgi:hypothetical protein
MKATVMYGASNVRVENVSDTQLIEPTSILDGHIEPRRVFDWTGIIDQVLDSYRAMNAREAIKAMIEF